MIIRRRIKSALEVFRNIACGGTAAMMGFFIVTNVFGLLPVAGRSATPTLSKEQEYRRNREIQTISNNIMKLSHLYDNTWEILSMEERIDILQTVADIERDFLGLPHDLTVYTASLPNDIAGRYGNYDHGIYVNENCIKNDLPYDLTKTIAHEAHHAFAWCLIAAYEEASEEMKSLVIFENAEKYKEEFDNYNDGAEDIFGYYTQKCESDARDYGIFVADRYKEAIQHFLETNTIAPGEDYDMRDSFLKRSVVGFSLRCSTAVDDLVNLFV